MNELYRLLINGDNFYEGPSMMQLICVLYMRVTLGDKIEIWFRKRTRWSLVDGCVWTGGCK